MKITPLTPAAPPQASLPQGCLPQGCLPLDCPYPGAQLWWHPLPGAALDGLTPEELAWGEALAPAGRKRYWQSRAAMRQVLAVALGCAPQAVPLQSPPGQPPDLEGGWVSLSHSGEGLLIGHAPLPIGVDLEWGHRRFDAAALMQRFFPADEQRQLSCLAAEPLRSAVLRSWLAKEAAIKWRQRTLAAELAHWSFDHGRGVLQHRLESITCKPSEGVMGPWRWACVSEAAELLGTPPITWPFDHG